MSLADFVATELFGLGDRVLLHFGMGFCAVRSRCHILENSTRCTYRCENLKSIHYEVSHCATFSSFPLLTSSQVQIFSRYSNTFCVLAAMKYAVKVNWILWSGLWDRDANIRQTIRCHKPENHNLGLPSWLLKCLKVKNTSHKNGRSQWYQYVMLSEHNIESRGPIRGGEFYAQLRDCQGAYTGLCSVAFVRQNLMTEILMSVPAKTIVFWNVMPRGLVNFLVTSNLQKFFTTMWF
jgi:hypothetical protein